MHNKTLLQPWYSVAPERARQIILPDGCCDLIVRHRPCQRPVWFVSDLADGPRQVALGPGDRHTGFRLYPGVRIDRTGLLGSMHDDLSETDIKERLHSHVTPLSNVADALAAISAGTGQAGGIALVAARLGVQIRSLQRLLQRETGRTPVFWMRLARVRRAASLVGCSQSLAQLAYDQGYADQAHMTREFRHWLGLTPHRIRLESGWTEQHLGVGYGA